MTVLRQPVQGNGLFGRIDRGRGGLQYVEFIGQGASASTRGASPECDPLLYGDNAVFCMGAPWLGGGNSSVTFKQEFPEAKLVVPVSPSKIVCIGRNYRAHASELGNEVPAEPMLFFKPPSSVVGPGDAIVLPPTEVSERVDYEAELAIVMGKRARHVTPQQAREYIFGFTCANDVSSRDLQKKDGQWARAKGMDTFCPIGPVIRAAHGRHAFDPSAVGVRARVNGTLRQDGSTADMVHPCDAIVAYISRFITLEPGDVVLTGTPAGVGPIAPGDVVVVEIDGIGALVNRVVSAEG